MPTPTLDIQLVPVGRDMRASEEDWYIEAGSVRYGYLYRVGAGYAIGICGSDPDKIEFSSIEDTKDAAIEYARTHIRRVRASTNQGI